MFQTQVIEDDQARHGAQVYTTNIRGQVPPLVTTSFTVQDQGESWKRPDRPELFCGSSRTDP